MMSSVMCRKAAVAVTLASLAAVAYGQPTIDAGTFYLNPNEANQAISLSVTGGDAVQGMELYAQIGDGTAGPLFQGADILTGTIFEPNHLDLDGGSYVDPWHLYQGVLTASGTVSAEGKIATLTLNTTGLFGGTYALRLINELENDETNFTVVPANLVDGTLIIIPEPVTCSLLLAGAFGLLMRRRSKGGS